MNVWTHPVESTIHIAVQSSVRLWTTSEGVMSGVTLTIRHSLLEDICYLQFLSTIMQSNSVITSYAAIFRYEVH